MIEIFQVLIYGNHISPSPFSHVELGQLSGVAAILRFPLPEPEDSDNSDDDDNNS